MKELMQLNSTTFKVAGIEENGFSFSKSTGYNLEQLLSNPSITESPVAIPPPALNQLKLKIGSASIDGMVEEFPASFLATDLYYPLDRSLESYLGRTILDLQSNFSVDKALAVFSPLEDLAISKEALADYLSRSNQYQLGAIATRVPSKSLIEYQKGNSNWFSRIHRGSIANENPLDYKYLSNPISAEDEIVLQDTSTTYTTVFATPITLSKATTVCVSCYMKSSTLTEVYGMYLAPANTVDSYLAIEEGSGFKIDESQNRSIYAAPNFRKLSERDSIQSYCTVDTQWKRYFKTGSYSAGSYYVILYWPKYTSNGSQNRANCKLSIAGLCAEASSVPSIYDPRYIDNGQGVALQEKVHPIALHANLADRPRAEWALAYQRLIYSSSKASNDSTILDSIGDVSYGYRGNKVIINKTEYELPDIDSFYNQWELVTVCKRSGAPAQLKVLSQDRIHSYTYSLGNIHLPQFVNGLPFDICLGTHVSSQGTAFTTTNGLYRDLQITTPDNLNNVIHKALQFTKSIDSSTELKKENTTLITSNIEEN